MQTPTENNIWERLKVKYFNDISNNGMVAYLPTFRRYIEPSRFSGEKNWMTKTELSVNCDTQEQRDWLDCNFKSEAKRILMGYYNKPADDIALRFVFDEPEQICGVE